MPSLASAPGGIEPAVEPSTTIIDSEGQTAREALAEVWQARELLYFFAWRDVKVRYKQTGAGILWAILQPLAVVLLFSVVFGGVKAIADSSVPYPIFIQSGMLPWLLFAQALTYASTSLVKEASMLTKIYFPRVLLPISSVAAGVIDFAVSLSVLLVLSVAFGVALTWKVLLLPLLIIFVLTAAIGVGIWLAALNVRFRDIQHALPFVSQLWFFATPIVYSLSLVPSGAREFMALNPMVGISEAFRWALVDGDAVASHVVTAAVICVCTLVGGLLFFNRMQRSFADTI